MMNRCSGHVLGCKHRQRRYWVAFLLASLVWRGATAQDQDLQQLKTLSLEELTSVEVSISGKKVQSADDIAAAVYVVTQADIRRSGVSSIPEALRLVPGMHVSQIDANKWAISIRGFNSRIANKLLVMVDGRSVYSTLFSGVFWELQDYVLADIQRIEVIRGPGGSDWGANAVNGVINIITYSASETQGTLVNASLGTEESATTIRHGGQLADDAFYRVFAKYRHQDDSRFFDNTDATDGWHDLRAGFRVDWNRDADVMVQGEIYTGQFGERIRVLLPSPPFVGVRDDEIDVSGGHILGRMNWASKSGAHNQLQFYFDESRRNQWTIDDTRRVADLTFQSQLSSFDGHDLVWGMGYRFQTDDVPAGDFLIGQSYFFVPESRSDRIYNAFVQDELELSQRLSLTIGAKFEHNSLSGAEFQPSVRVRWKRNERDVVWGAISRAVRTPSRAERDGNIGSEVLDAGPPVLVAGLIGTDSYDSESVIAYELGMRRNVNRQLRLEVAAFYNDYDDLQSIEPGAPFSVPLAIPIVVNPLNAANNLFGETYGLELSVEWQPSDSWAIRANYSYLDIQLHTRPASGDTFSEIQEGISAKHQLNLLAGYSPSENWSLSFRTHYVDDLPGLGVDSYVDLDAGVTWNLRKNTSLVLQGKNLIHDRHIEFLPTFFPTAATQIEREVVLKVDWRF